VRKVAIVAKAATSALAPWHDEEWEIWGLPWISYPRCDRMFEMHHQSMAALDPDPYFREDRWAAEFARKPYGECPVYCDASRMRLFANPVEYPIKAVKAELPIPFLENSIAYQIALAIHERVDEIGLYGVHMVGASEYIAERPSVTYLIGLAQGRGIKVTIAAGSPLMASYWMKGRYGLSSEKRPTPV
jgi:hypothetical protein